MAGDARSDILDRVRAAAGERRSVSREMVAQQWQSLPRLYTRAAERSREEILELLEDRLRDYDAYVERVDRSDLSRAIDARLQLNGRPRMIVPSGIPDDLLVPDSFTEDAGFSSAVLDGFNGVVTTVSVAIALTGTLVIQHVPGQGRRATTLIPDYHLCLVNTDRVVESVPEAMAWLAPTATLATTFISGPSATADIEMTRIKGVHGPRVLDVLLVDGLS